VGVSRWWAGWDLAGDLGKAGSLEKKLKVGTNPTRVPLFIDFCTYTAGLEAPFSRWQLSIMQGLFSISMN